MRRLQQSCFLKCWKAVLLGCLAILIPQFPSSLLRGAEDVPPAAIPIRENLLDQMFERPYLIDIDRPIDGLFYWYLNNRLDRAEVYGADVVIVRLTTPGGDLEHSLMLARRLRDLKWAKTVVWIPTEAISGGAIVSLGANAIYMQQQAILGDAGPVMFGPRGEFRHAEEKIVSYTATAIRELAQSSGRPPAVAEAMVDRKLKVYPATHRITGQTVFFDEKQIGDPALVEEYEIGEPIAEAGNDRFLTVAARRAKELQLCDEVFVTESDMLQRLAKVAPVVTRLDWKDRLVYNLNRPWLTALLLIVGIIGLYLELTAPGIGLPGLLAMMCFGVFFWSHFLGGTAGWLEVLFFSLGVTCLMMEIFVLPGFGIFGISGLGMIAVALVMATQDFLVPATPMQWMQFRNNSLSVLIAFLCLGGLIAIQVMVFDSIPGLSRFQLRPEEVPHNNIEDNLQQESRISLGDKGISQSDLRPSGKVLIGEQLVDVLTEGDYVERGVEVAVIRVEGNIVTVRRVR